MYSISAQALGDISRDGSGGTHRRRLHAANPHEACQYLQWRIAPRVSSWHHRDVRNRSNDALGVKQAQQLRRQRYGCADEPGNAAEAGAEGPTFVFSDGEGKGGGGG